MYCLKLILESSPIKTESDNGAPHVSAGKYSLLERIMINSCV